MVVSIEKYMHANEKIGQDFVVRMLQQVRLHCLSKFEVFIVSYLKLKKMYTVINTIKIILTFIYGYQIGLMTLFGMPFLWTFLAAIMLRVAFGRRSNLCSAGGLSASSLKRIIVSWQERRYWYAPCRVLARLATFPGDHFSFKMILKLPSCWSPFCTKS